MKKLQTYLMKPEELRKKLENPRFRQDFIEWSKSNTSVSKDQQSRHSRSKSPVDNIQRSLQLHPKRTPSNAKENAKPPALKSHTPLPKNSSRTPLASKPTQERRSELPIKRNTSNSLLKGPGEQTRTATADTSQKSRYNSCSAMDYQRRQRSSSQLSAAPLPEEPKRIKQRYSYRTRQGAQINNPNKVNQDSLVIKTNLADRNANLYAVADGHGAFGHLVSQYLVKNISKSFEAEAKGSLTEAIPKVFEKLQRGLTESDINASCSGSTLVGVLIENDEVICANVGDSRAILARQSKPPPTQSTARAGN